MMILKSNICGLIVQIFHKWQNMNCKKCQNWSGNSEKCDHFGNCVKEYNYCILFVPMGKGIGKERILKMWNDHSQRFIRENTKLNEKTSSLPGEKNMDRKEYNELQTLEKWYNLKLSNFKQMLIDNFPENINRMIELRKKLINT